MSQMHEVEYYYTTYQVCQCFDYLPVLRQRTCPSPATDSDSVFPLPPTYLQLILFHKNATR